MHRGQKDDNYLFIIHQLNLFYVTPQFRILYSERRMRAAGA